MRDPMSAVLVQVVVIPVELERAARILAVVFPTPTRVPTRALRMAEREVQVLVARVVPKTPERLRAQIRLRAPGRQQVARVALAARIRRRTRARVQARAREVPGVAGVVVLSILVKEPSKTAALKRAYRMATGTSIPSRFPLRCATRVAPAGITLPQTGHGGRGLAVGRAGTKKLRCRKV